MVSPRAPRDHGGPPQAGRILQAGAYGVRITGLHAASTWMQAVPEPFEQLTVVRESADPGPVDYVDEQVAHFVMPGGVTVETRRSDDSIVVRSRHDPTDDDLLHPLTSPVIAVRHLWAGRQVLHGGVVGMAEGAVVVLGGREFGKSSTAAHLAATTTLDVFSDDLCVTDGHVAWTGPRCLDLREEAFAAFEHRWPGRLVRSAARWRMTLGPTAASVPLVGSVLLGWASSPEVERVEPAEALRTVVASKMHRELPSDGVALLSLGARPMLSIRRSRTLATLPMTSEAIERWVRRLCATGG